MTWREFLSIIEAFSNVEILSAMASYPNFQIAYTLLKINGTYFYIVTHIYSIITNVVHV